MVLDVKVYRFGQRFGPAGVAPRLIEDEHVTMKEICSNWTRTTIASTHSSTYELSE